MYVVEKIIGKAENSSNDWKEGVTGKRKLQIGQEDYDAAGRNILNDELLYLENSGLVKVQWWSKPYEAQNISYRIDMLPAFYDIKRKEMELKGDFSFKTKQERIIQYRKIVLNAMNAEINQEWIRKYFAWLIQKLDEGKEVRDFVKLQDYLLVLQEINQLDAPVLKTEFSKKLFNDAKKFQREIENHIVTVFKKYTDGIDKTISNKDVLTILNIEEDEKEIEVKEILKVGGVNKYLFHPTDEEYEELLKMYHEVEQPIGTTKEVGDALENLVKFLFNLCDGFDVSGIRTPLNQIDCYVQNKMYLKYGIFNMIGGRFFIECKNEKRTPSGDVLLKLEAIISNMNSPGKAEGVKFGIIVSKEKGPETFIQNATKAYLTRGIIIISICGEELKKLFEERGNLLDLIEQKVFDVIGGGKISYV